MAAEFDLQQVVEATRGKILEQKEQHFTSVVTDSRKIIPGCLFVALKGEKFNGESFVTEALAQGAAGALVSNTFSDAGPFSGTVVAAEGDTQTAYQQLAACWRQKFNIPVVTITGSNGKTTTKDLTASVLGAKLYVLKTQANFNNEIGLPLTLLQLEEKHQAAVVEIGMRGLGQIKALAPIASPTIGIVTNVGETHMELLGSIENIAKAKAELVEAIKPGGTVILNNDNQYTAAMTSKCQENVRVVTFGIDQPADIRASEIESDGGSTKFKCTLSATSEARDFVLPIVGRHNVYNALAAIAAGVVLGLSYEVLHAGLLKLDMSRMRFEYQQVGDYNVINDAYNASPMSMKATLDTMAEVVKGRYGLVLGDMLELGDVSQEAHRTVGRQVAACGAEFLVAYGQLGEYIAEGARLAGMKNIHRAKNHQEAAELLLKLMKSGDTVLLKASRGMALEKIIDQLEKILRKRGN